MLREFEILEGVSVYIQTKQLSEEKRTEAQEKLIGSQSRHYNVELALWAKMMEL